MLPSPPADLYYGPIPKRKRSDLEAEETSNQTFHLENLADSTCLSFEPVSKLLRAHLPLSWLGSAASNPCLPSGTLLHGDIQHVTAWEYSVLAARQVPNGGLVVLEKVEHDCFVAHPLQPFVTDQWIRDATIGAAPPVSMQMMLHYLPNEPSLPPILARTPSLPAETSWKIPKNRRGAAARLSILSQSEKQEEGSSTLLMEDISPAKEGEPTESQVELQHALDEAIPSQQAEREGQGTGEEPQQVDHLSPAYLRRRYLEFLYLTKESIAFYTKGPLNRARARARAENAKMSLAELAAFYRDSLLPAKKMDLKYRESLRSAIAFIVQESAPCNLHGEAPKKKSSRKTKLGKDGLWPSELDIIRKWWQKDFKHATSQLQQEVHIRNSINALRMREAELQIVLILEALSIEAKEQNKVSTAKEVGPEGPDIKVESIEQDDMADTQTDNKPKKRNLESTVEMLADKLCIWHSIGLEGVGSTTEISQAVLPDHDTNLSRDRLRNFCADVLMVFYNSKLPTVCKSICKILAGPELYGQVQNEARIKQPSARPAQPGAPVTRRHFTRPGTRERVISEEGLRHLSPPALTRSSALPSVPPFKRESSVALTRPPSRQTSVSFTNREVDFEAEAQATASKKRKLDRVASQKSELAAAIQALKKPNRQIAGKVYMDEMEQRKSRINQPVLIAATPKANRRKTIDPTEGRLPSPAADASVIASSSIKQKNVENLSSASRSSTKKRAVLAAIYDSPSRNMGKTSVSARTSSGLNARPEQHEAASVFQDFVFATPAKPRQKSASESFTTPIKPASTDKENGFRLTDMAFRTMERAMAMRASDTIYDTLGWNDDLEV